MLNKAQLDRSRSNLKDICTDGNFVEPEINEKIQYIVSGYVRNAQYLLLSSSDSRRSSFYSELEEESSGSNKENELITNKVRNGSTDTTSSMNSVSVGELSTFDFDKSNTFNDKISNIVLLYYYDELTQHTNVLYRAWSDLKDISLSDSQIEHIKQFYFTLIEEGYNPKRLPPYEMLRYFYGTTSDMNRALFKWKGSVDTYTYYNLNQITKEQIKTCINKLTKSCQFCGFHNDEDKPSPVFVLNYEYWNWSDFDDINHVIKASFYIVSWMTDHIETINNGITFMISAKGIRFHHIKRCMTLLRAMQRSLPLRTNHIFFLNLPSLARNSMKLFLKIYPKHIQDKMHVCASTDSLYELLPPSQIPQMFGGTLNRDNKLEMPCLGVLLSNYIDIKDFKHFQVDDSDYDIGSDYETESDSNTSNQREKDDDSDYDYYD